MTDTHLKLFFSEQLAETPPTANDIAAIMKHLHSDPDAYFIIEYKGGYFQGYEDPEQSSLVYHLEFADIDEETAQIHTWENCEAVSMEQFAAIVRLVIEQNEQWREVIPWQEMDLSLPGEGELELGQFSPSEAHKLLNALDEKEIPVRMEQVTGTSFALIISGTDLPRANDVMAKAMNLQV